MSRYKKADENKAAPTTISLNLKYIGMLKELEFKLQRNRSQVIQYLIEEEYKKQVQLSL